MIQHTSEKFYKKSNEDNEEQFIQTDELKLDNLNNVLYSNVNQTQEDNYDEKEMTELLKANIPEKFNNVKNEHIPQLYSCIEQTVNGQLPSSFIFEYIEQHYDIDYSTVFNNLLSFQQNRILKEYGQETRTNTLF